MSYSYDCDKPVVAEIGGRRYWSWTIEETGTESTDVFVVTGLPMFFTITLFEAKLLVGSASTLDPVISLESDDDLDQVVSNVTPDDYIRNDCPVRVFAPRSFIKVRSQPDSGADNRIKTRITIMEGHG